MILDEAVLIRAKAAARRLTAMQYETRPTWRQLAVALVIVITMNAGVTVEIHRLLT